MKVNDIGKYKHYLISFTCGKFRNRAENKQKFKNLIFRNRRENG